MSRRQKVRKCYPTLKSPRMDRHTDAHRQAELNIQALINFLSRAAPKYWTKLNFNNNFFKYFMFSSRFMLFSTFKKIFGVKKILNTFPGVSRYMLFSTLKIYFLGKYWKVPLHLLVKWEVVSPNTGSRWGQWESISNISSIPLF